MLARRALQPKLTVGAVDDPYEREAERVASQVTAGVTMNAPGAGAPPSDISRQPDTEASAKALRNSGASFTPAITPLVRRTAYHNNTSEQFGSFDVDQDMERQLASGSGGGNPLPARLRSELEPRFGTDFSNVRVHTGTQANQLNRSINAQAFTHSNHIYMATGNYSPGTGAGKHLLAHELTHVVQQTGATAGSPVRRRAATGVVQRFRLANLFKSSSKSTKSGTEKGGGEAKGNKKQEEGAKTEDVQLQDAVEYEKNLGRFIFNHPKANAAANVMLNKMATVLVGKIEEDNLEQQNKIAETFGKDKAESAGQVGKDPNAVIAVLKEGNLRERLTAIYNVMFTAFMTYITGGMETNAWQEMGDKGLNVEKLKRRKRQMKWNVGSKGLYRDPGNPLDRKNFSSYEHTGGTRDEAKGFSERTVGELGAQKHSIGLSEREKAVQFPGKKDDEIENEKLKWQEGGTYWKMRETNKWVAKVRDTLHMPVVAGPSGTLLRMFQVWEYLNKPVSNFDWRLAVLGYMLSSNDHSFHEMMMTAADFGMPYKPGPIAYTNVNPLTVWELRENVAKDGLFPHELAFKRKTKAGGYRMVDKEDLSYAKETVRDADEEDRGAVSGPGMAAIQLYTAFGYLILNPARQGGMFAGKKVERNLTKKDELANMKGDFESGKLTAEDLIQEAKEIIPLLENALEMMPNVTKDVFRGTGSFNPFAFRKGTRMSFGAFTSTTTEEDVAKGFADDFNVGPFKYILHMKDTTGKDINEFSMAGGENEILLSPGAAFEVTDRTKPTKTDKYYHVFMKQTAAGGTKLELGKSTPPPKVQEVGGMEPQIDAGPVLQCYDAKGGKPIITLQGEDKDYTNLPVQEGEWTLFSYMMDGNDYWAKTDEFEAFTNPAKAPSTEPEPPKKNYDHIKDGLHNLAFPSGSIVSGFDDIDGDAAVTYTFGADHSLKIKVVGNAKEKGRCRVEIMGTGKGLFVPLDALFDKEGNPTLAGVGPGKTAEPPKPEIVAAMEATLNIYFDKDDTRDAVRVLAQDDKMLVDAPDDQGDGWTEFNYLGDFSSYYCRTDELEAFMKG